MAIRSNLIVSIDEDAVSGDTSVLNFKTTESGNLVVEMSVPKVAIKLEDLEQAAIALRSFVLNNKHIEVIPNKESQFVVEFGKAE